jgi:hypothetical protein
MTLLSICIPVYEAQGRGIEFLAQNFKQLKLQTLKDFEIVVSDNSADDVIEKYVAGIKDLNIKYVKNEGAKNIGGNTNNAIKNATGEIIQIMCQDDYFYNKNSLQKIVDNFDRNIGWMVSMYMHTKDRLGLFKQQIPSWNDQIYFTNTIGAPSCLSFLNDDNKVWVDENLTCFVDCEHYYCLYKKWGLPKVLKELIFVQLLWEGQVTNTGITQNMVDTEVAYINDKLFGKKKKKLDNVTLLAYSSHDVDATIASMVKCMGKMDFGAVKLLSHEKPANLPNGIIYENAPLINSFEDYSRYMFLELGRHVDTSHVLVVQYDSCISHPELWKDEWLNFDYAGAVWPVVENNYLTDEGERVRVGNGGFSLRSKKLLDAPKTLGLNLEERQGFYNEDGNCAIYHRTKMLNYGIKYMPIEEACIFSHENNVPENAHIKETFGYHHHKQPLKD